MESNNKAKELNVAPPPERQMNYNQNGDQLATFMDASFILSISILEQVLSVSQAAERKTNAKVSIDHAMLELRDLKAQYSAAKDWKEADDYEVKTAITVIKDWECKFKEIKKECIPIKNDFTKEVSTHSNSGLLGLRPSSMMLPELSRSPMSQRVYSPTEKPDPPH